MLPALLLAIGLTAAAAADDTLVLLRVHVLDGGARARLCEMAHSARGAFWPHTAASSPRPSRVQTGASVPFAVLYDESRLSRARVAAACARCEAAAGSDDDRAGAEVRLIGTDPATYVERFPALFAGQGNRSPAWLHPEIALVDFFADPANSAYAYVWFVEYDCAFTGPISALVDAYRPNSADLIGVNVRNESRQPGYYWWSSVNFVPPGGKVTMGVMIARFSRRFLRLAQTQYARGRIVSPRATGCAVLHPRLTTHRPQGYVEVLLPSLCAAAGPDACALESIEKHSPFVYKTYDKHPFSAAAYARIAARSNGTLVHPVKEGAMGARRALEG